MAIPVEPFYQPSSLGAGHVATTQPVVANSDVAAADIKYGQAVTIKDGAVIPATAAPIYGVALKRSYMDTDRFIDPKDDTWHTGETLAVLREGTVAVPLSADVNKGEGATIDANGLFKPASGSDVLVGIFTSSGNTDDTAFLQTNLGFNSSATTGEAPASSTGA